MKFILCLSLVFLAFYSHAEGPAGATFQEPVNNKDLIDQSQTKKVDMKDKTKKPAKKKKKSTETKENPGEGSGPKAGEGK